MNLSPASTPSQKPAKLDTPLVDLMEAHNRSLELSSSTSPIRGGGNLPSIRSVRNLEGAHRRFDQAFTLSWANKKIDKKDKKRANDSPLAQAQSRMNGLTTESPLTKKNRRFVVHLSSEIDNLIHKVPLYKNEVLEIRQQNDRILKQILANKHEYKKDYNKIAQENRFGQFRSSSVHPRVSQDMQHERSIGNNSVEFNSQKELNNSLRSSLLRGDLNRVGEIVKDNKDPSMQILNQEAPSWSTIPSKVHYEKPKLLEELEEIYHKDLKKTHKKNRSQSFSAERLGINNPEVVEKEAEHLKKNRNFLHDDVLMRKLKDPYSKKLPYDKPVTSNIRHPMIQHLQAIETKAEVLRNIKEIEKLMKREANSIASLPRIKENPSEEESQLKLSLAKVKPRRHKKKVNTSRKESENLKFWSKLVSK